MIYPPIKLIDRHTRERAGVIVSSAPDGYIVTVKEPTRSLDQNAKMWAMIEDIRRAEPMGWKYDKHQWKGMIMKACGEEVQFLPDFDGGFFPFGFESSRLTVRQMSMMIEFMYAFGAEKGIEWSEKHPYEPGR